MSRATFTIGTSSAARVTRMKAIVTDPALRTTLGEDATTMTTPGMPLRAATKRATWTTACAVVVYPGAVVMMSRSTTTIEVGGRVGTQKGTCAKPTRAVICVHRSEMFRTAATDIISTTTTDTATGRTSTAPHSFPGRHHRTVAVAARSWAR